MSKCDLEKPWLYVTSMSYSTIRPAFSYKLEVFLSYHE